MPDALPPAAAKPAVLDDEGARALVARYGATSPVAAKKDIGRIDAHMKRFIETAPFCCVSTADADGRQDATPRGDPPGSFRVIDERTLAIPDRPGNNRLDTLRNLLVNPQIGLLFMIPGMNETTRVNGVARLSVDAELLASMAVQGKPPLCAIVVEVREAYMHCPKAFMRSKLWDPEARIDRASFPSLICMIGDQVGLAEAERNAAEARSARAYREGLWEHVKP
ncbi:MAG: pyridoxamine 5'-phosphate oxidase family protein [Rhodospirillales bacterium]|nr:MAG: pyridoxamine 5'-phosphate oxidase family protein [Rhodospirillales bacterium]